MPRANGIAASLKSLCRAGLAAGVIGLGVVSPASGGVGCNSADLAPPFGVLDLADINAFTSAFVNQHPAADLAPPFGVFDLADINAFVSDFTAGCPATACFPDIRTTIEGAHDDPADVQWNYDAINRTIHLFGPLSLGQIFSQPVGALLPFLHSRLETLNDCVPSSVDPAAIALVLEQLADATGPVPVGQILLFDPGSDPFWWILLDELRALGIGVPEQSASEEEFFARLEALPGVIEVAGAVTVADLFFKNVTEVSDAELFALDEGKNSGLVFAAVCNNDKCCVRDGGPIPGTDRCRTETRFCNLPPPSRAFCSIASDRCP